MFHERRNPKTTITAMESALPVVGITPSALTKMQVYVSECPKEIGWLGTAHRDSNGNYIISDVYLFDQEVHATTTEITPDGLSSFAEELMQKGEEGIEIWNSLKMWGHSHVNMGVSPSGQDNSQMETFKEGGHNWFIRLIANKKGELKIDIYDYEKAVIYLDLPWQTLEDRATSDIQEQINTLYAQLDALEKERKAHFEAPIKEEMKVKVRDKKYEPLTYASKQGDELSRLYGTAIWKGGKRGFYVGNEWKSEKELMKKHKKKEASKKTSTVTPTTTGVTDIGAIGDAEYDQIIDDEDVFTFFSHTCLEILGEIRNFDDMVDELYLWGYGDGYFSDNDIERIMRVAIKVYLGGNA